MFSVATVSVAVIVLITSILIYLRRKFTYWYRHGVPGPLHEFNGFLVPQHIHCARNVKNYGSVYGYYDFMGKNMAVTDPDIIRDMMTKDFHAFPEHRHMYFGPDRINLNLFNLPGNADWKRIRSIITPAFTSGKLRAMTEHMSELSDILAKNLEHVADNSQVVDIKVYIGSFVMDVITSCAYGINADSLNNPDHPIVANAKMFFSTDASFSLALGIVFPPLAKLLNLYPFDINAIEFFDSLTKKIIAERKRLSEFETKSAIKRKIDFLQLIINANETINNDLDSNDKDIDAETSRFSHITNEYDDNNDTANLTLNKVNSNANTKHTLTDDELTAQCILFFIAGYDTTGATLSHCFYYLAQNETCQQLLYEELMTVEEVNLDSLVKCEYLNAVIMETLRMAPPLLRIQRHCAIDYKLANTGVTVPAGSTITFLPYPLHRDPKYFNEPDLFKPERFLKSGVDVEPSHPYAFIPFGGGPRACVGSRFAMIEMRMCIAKLVRQFKFRLAPDFKIDYYNGNILFSPKHVLLLIEKRLCTAL